MHLRGSNLGAFGKRTAVLIDHDEVTDRNQATEVRINEAKNTGDVLVWSRKSILNGATGCDLEIILAMETPVAALAQSLKSIYIEAKDEHPMIQAAWTKAKKPLRASDLLASQVPAEFPNPESYDFASLD